VAHVSAYVYVLGLFGGNILVFMIMIVKAISHSRSFATLQMGSGSGMLDS
jgi:hypothetical protein